MGIDIDSAMMVCVEFDELPDEIKEVECIYNWMDENGLDYASLWYDAGTEGMIIGKILDNNIYEKDFALWSDDMKEVFEEVRNKTKCEPTLTATQNVW